MPMGEFTVEGNRENETSSKPQPTLPPGGGQTAPPLGPFSYAHFPNEDAPQKGATGLRSGEGR